MTTGQISVTTTATLIVVANPARSCCLITPTADLYIGGSAVVSGPAGTANAGLLIKANQTYPIESTAAIYGITASGTSTATYADESSAGFPVGSVN